jgi:hypothetical protein
MSEAERALDIRSRNDGDAAPQLVVQRDQRERAGSCARGSGNGSNALGEVHPETIGLRSRTGNIATAQGQGCDHGWTPAKNMSRADDSRSKCMNSRQICLGRLLAVRIKIRDAA